MIFHPHTYQTRAIDFVVGHPCCALFLDMGLGKTVATLTAIDELMNDYLDVEKVLVIAPKSVARNTWSAESSKWDHLQHLQLSLVMGTAAQREKALEAPAHIYVTNRDNVVWLVEHYRKTGWPFDCVVIDESSSFKNLAAKRYKAITRVRPFIRRMILLTGTPSPNGLMDLYPQVKLLDGGQRLGRHIGQFREIYFRPGARNGAVIYEWVPRAGAQDRIAERIGDICLAMQASDYLEMPMVLDGGMTLELDEAQRRSYAKFQRDCVLALPDGGEIEAVTAVALTTKLLQFASGAIYDADREWHPVSEVKTEALADLVEASGEPVLVYYNYQHELARIRETLKDYDPVFFNGQPDVLRRWNAGEIRVMLCHPASVAYGLNMQEGGRIIVWFSPTWNLELYQQANARLIRQGQAKPVLLYHLIVKGTMDETVMESLNNKDRTQSTLLRHIKRLRDEAGMGRGQ